MQGRRFVPYAGADVTEAGYAMKKARFSEEQIVSILRECGAGMDVTTLCRKHGISDTTYYKWRLRYGAVAVADPKPAVDLAAEHSKLQRRYADLARENTAMKELIAKMGGAGQGTFG